MFVEMSPPSTKVASGRNIVLLTKKISSLTGFRSRINLFSTHIWSLLGQSFDYLKEYFYTETLSFAKGFLAKLCVHCAFAVKLDLSRRDMMLVETSPPSTKVPLGTIYNFAH